MRELRAEAVRQIFFKKKLDPASLLYTILLAQFFGVLAQLVERMAGSHEVTGSNPVHSTMKMSQVQ